MSASPISPAAPPNEISVEPDPEKLSLYGVTLQQLEAKIQGANRSFLAGSLRRNGRMFQAVAGRTLSGVPDIGLLLVTTRDGRPVYVRDVAKVVIGPSPAEHHVWSMTRAKSGWSLAPAVTIAFAKRAGANAVVVSEALVDQAQALKGSLITGRRQCRSHPRLRQDRQRQGERASVPSGAGHGLDRASDRLRDRLA